nr:hypothetical protein [bacterium]
SYADKTSEEEIIDVIKFKDLGDVIDLMRKSSLFADQSHSLDGPGKEIYRGLLNHEMLASLVTADVKADLLTKYSQTNVNVSDTFAEVDNMIAVAKKLANVANSVSEISLDNVSKEDIATILDTITDASSVIGTMVSEENLANLGVDAEVITEITNITNQLATASSEDKEKEVEGIATVLDIAMQAQTGENITIEDTDALIGAIEDSTIISTMLKDSSSIVSDVSVGAQQLDPETKTALAESIDNVADSDLQAALKALFGIE